MTLTGARATLTGADGAAGAARCVLVGAAERRTQDPLTGDLAVSTAADLTRFM